MKILALENSTVHGSVALLEDDRELLTFEFVNDRKHSGSFFESLAQLGEHLSNLKTVVVGLGPGSYAGVRIAIASAIGISASGKVKLMGLPSICAMSAMPNEYCVIGDARRDSFFFVRIVDNQIAEGIDLYDKNALRMRLKAVANSIPICSSDELPNFPEVVVRFPSATLLGKLINRGTVHSLESPLQPLYLREPHITIPNDKRNLSLLGRD